MAWTQFSTFNTGDLLTATHMNNIVANLEYLAAGKFVVQEPATSGDYTTTSTSLVDVDATEFDVDITVGDDAGAVRVWAQLHISVTASNSVVFEFTRDGTVLANGTYGVQRYYEAAGGQGFPIHFEWIDDGITPGNTHSYRLQWKVSGGTGLINAASGFKPLLVVEEVH